MKFNFGRQKSKIGISMENKNKLNSLSIQRKSVDKSRMSFLSSMTDKKQNKIKMKDYFKQ